LFVLCFTVLENAGMPENYRLIMDYEYQGKKEKFHKLKYIVFEIYTVYYQLDFTKYLLSKNIISRPYYDTVDMEAAVSQKSARRYT
jgi:hypothetical protein